MAFPKEHYDLSLSRKLPGPPQFMMKHNNKVPYQVPPFFGFEHASTRWIIAMLSTQDCLRRLQELGRQNPSIFVTYYQIPDRPGPLMQGGESTNMERSAYNNKAILYLTPIALAVYLKKTDALRRLLNIKDEKGNAIIHPNTPCFVQKSMKRGMLRCSNDLCNTSPGMLAIRREFPEALCCLMEAGYAPQKPFSIIYRKPYAETVTFYRDIIDYSIDLLKVRPGFNLAHVMHIITTAPMRTRYDIFMYDVVGHPENGDSEGEWISIFRRVVQLGLTNQFYNQECGMSIIALLEEIHKQGFFVGNLSQAVERETEYGYDVQYEEKDQENICRKINGGQILKMPEETRNCMMDHDKAVIIGSLVFWYQSVLFKRRMLQMARLQDLLVRVLLDTFIIEIFFDQEDEGLANTFTEWAESKKDEKVNTHTVSLLRIAMSKFISTNDILRERFYGLYEDTAPAKLNVDQQRIQTVQQQQHNFSSREISQSTSSPSNAPLNQEISSGDFNDNYHSSLLASQSATPSLGPGPLAAASIPCLTRSIHRPKTQPKKTISNSSSNRRAREPSVSFKDMLPSQHERQKVSIEESKSNKVEDSPIMTPSDTEYIRSAMDSFINTIKKTEIQVNKKSS